MSVCHICEQPLTHRVSTAQQPYHDTESGLSNVYVIGVDVYSCAQCGIETASIPQPEQLHLLLAKNILLKPEAMTGEEFRFLRKETKMRPTEFGQLLGVDRKTILKWEESKTLSKQNDVTVRFVVANALREISRWGGAITDINIEIPNQLIANDWTKPDQDIEDLAKVNTALRHTAEGWEADSF